jgi:hypothetical protein
MVLSPLSKILFRRGIAWRRRIIGRSSLAAKRNRRSGKTVIREFFCQFFLDAAVFERVTIRTFHSFAGRTEKSRRERPQSEAWPLVE